MKEQEKIYELYCKYIRKTKNIASLKKMDLHIHTPASNDYIYSEKNITKDEEYKKLINKFIESDLDVIAITDHNTISGYEEIQQIINENKEIRKKLLRKYIMPGVEVTCFARHFLVYFSEEIKIDKIKAFLKRCGIDENEKNNEKLSADRVTPLTLCEIADEYDAFVCLAHADGNKGFLEDYLDSSKKNKEFTLNGGIVEKVLKTNSLFGVSISNEKNREKINKIIKNFRSDLKIFKASDSHSILDKENYDASGKPMGTHFFYANIGELNFRTIKSFFKNSDTEIVENIPEKNNSYIKSICIKDSFVQGKNKENEWAIIPFSRELNCFIGTRGTGKSTIIDIIKYAFNFWDKDTYDIDEIDEYIKPIIQGINEYDEIEEKDNIISRFEEIVLFVDKDNNMFAIEISPNGINKPNINIYKYEDKDKAFKLECNAKKFNDNKMNKIITFVNDISPIVYKQKDILEIGNNKFKVTKAIELIIEKIVGKEYQELNMNKRKLQNQVNDICKKIDIERRKDENADNNSINLKNTYNQLLNVTEKINEINVDIINKMNEKLKDKLQITYEISLPENMKKEMIDRITIGNRNEKSITYEEVLSMKRQLNWLFSRLDNVHNLTYLLFTKQYDEISKKMNLEKSISIAACDTIYKYVGDYVSIIPQIIIDFNLNVNYGINNRKVFKPRLNLSFGQKAVGILLILLYGTTVSNNNQTIILDQPEDDLDNAYVYKTLVKELEEVKKTRQIIVATHSPNIAVLGNTENIIVLKSNGEKSWIECNGTIFNSVVACEAIRILEGSEEAFMKREELYGFN